jgi:hypothetical protein
MSPAETAIASSVVAVYPDHAAAERAVGPDHGGREALHAQYRIAEHRGLRAYPGRPGHPPLER